MASQVNIEDKKIQTQASKEIGVMKDTLFSVLIANYNNGRYLQEAIDSVFAQTYTNWEIILIDDKSTDNSFVIYEKYKNDARFHIFFNDSNKGCGYTKRRCIELAHGELCGFLDPDDKLEENALEIMVEEHNNKPKHSLIYSTLYRWDDLTYTIIIEDLIGPMKEGENFLISSRNCVSNFAVFKKSFYNKTLGIDADLQSAEDVDNYLKLEEVGNIYFIDKPLYYYRQTNPHSVTIRSQEAKNEAFKNRMVAMLNAFVRRIKGKHPLFVDYKQKSLHVMRWQLGYYYRNCGHLSMRWLRYAYWYWRGNGCSIKSLNHIRKAMLK